MANFKISQLDDAAALDPADLLELEQPGETAGTRSRKVPLGTLAGYIADSVGLPVPLSWGGGIKLDAFLGITSGARQSLQLVQNRLYYLLGRPIGPVRVSNPTCEVNTGQASAIARAGICEWNAAAGAPGALIVDWGTADCSSGGTKTFTNGTAYADLDPTKAYARMFVIGGAAVGATLYYQPFSPESVPIYVPGTSMMLTSIYDGGSNATQRTSGFNNPVSVTGTITAEASANAPGWRNFLICDVEPIP